MLGTSGHTYLPVCLPNPYFSLNCGGARRPSRSKMLSFGEFELDEARRELRLAGEVIPLQPRVFDLLALLADNRDRVMSKDELLNTLWPDVVVGDGSLQRAVSLARTALKHGGMQDVLRNYPRQGYRFCVDAICAGPEDSAPTDLAKARSDFDNADWAAAVVHFQQADAESALEAADLERFADACQCSGAADDAEAVLERAVAAYGARGDRVGAARMALRLAELSFEMARVPVAKGWLAQARRCLEGRPECYENGFEAYLTSRMATAGGDLDSAHAGASRALEIGRRLGNSDIEALGRAYLGFAELALGNVTRGLEQMDEAAAAVLAGDISPRVGGIVYCALIWVCCNRGDWQRAAQWGESFARWCERTGMKRFSGTCQLHRAEVLSVSGEAEAAQAEIEKACEQLARYSPYAEGDAFRILGDFQLLRGDLEAARSAFLRAHKLGWDPQPGLAMLQAEQGEPETAIRGLVRSLAGSNWALRQRRALLLAELTVIAARDGDLEHARSALEELEGHPDLWESDYHQAAVAHARSEILFAENHLEAAVEALRQAIAHWQSSGSRLNLANGQLRLAEFLIRRELHTGAALELDAAEAAFIAMDAPARVAACQELRKRWDGDSA